MIAQRICIMGNSGSGKSTLARALGQKYNLPVFHLDQEMLTGQFESLPHEERVRKHNQMIKQDKWIIDGRYSKLMAPRLARADLVIFLDIPRWQVVPRTIKRTRQPEERLGAPAGAKSVYNWDLLSHQLRFNRRHFLKRLRTEMTPHPQAKLIVLRRGSVKQWIEQIDLQA